MARAGELQFVKAHEFGKYSGMLWANEESAFEKPGPDACTVHKGAIVATLPFRDGHMKLAIDATSAEASLPDVLRLDFTGEGRFHDAPTVPIKADHRGDWLHCRAEAETITVELDGQSLPVTIGRFYYRKPTRGARYLRLQLSTVAEGTCRFGDKEYAVRLIDGNNNLRLGDALAVERVDGRVRHIFNGDTVAIDTERSGFNGGRGVRVLLGHRAKVDGQWYEIEVSEDGRNISAERVKPEMAELVIDHDEWRATLCGVMYEVQLSGGRTPVKLPADDYSVIRFSQFKPMENGRVKAELQVNGYIPGRLGFFEALGGETTSVKIGEPLTARATFHKQGPTDQYWFQAELSDAGNHGVTHVSLGGGRRPPAPRIDFFAGDESIGQLSLEYG